MMGAFSNAEVDFVNGGGNLWYVAKKDDDGWDVVRWSKRQGHFVVSPAASSQQWAQQRLFTLIHPSSFRTRTAIHHQLTRPSEAIADEFPILL
ncbi:MAG: hypothetical protein V4723_21545 [Pseudomonadota bacterium]